MYVVPFESGWHEIIQWLWWIELWMVLHINTPCTISLLEGTPLSLIVMTFVLCLLLDTGT